ncbi:MAG: phosphoglycerate kinase, partial [Minisyncoccia bacterium]
MNILEKMQKYNIVHQTDLAGKKVMLRIDVNVSLGDNAAVDPGEDWRILQSLGTIEFLRDAGACVVILAHIGREPQETLKPVFEYMKQFFTLGFLPHFDPEMIKNTVSNMKHGSVVMMENLRQSTDEKENNIDSLQALVGVSDMYVNDAFSVSHRKHASLHAITKHLPSYFGLQFMDEINHLNNFMHHNDGMKTLVLGGAKFGTKLPLLEKLLPELDYILMGGALANVFLKARGVHIGKSFCDDVDISHMVDSDKIILPIDYIDEHGDVADIYDVRDNNMILDIGPTTTDLFEKIIDHSGSVMWNGPMGKYEDGYTEA